MTALDALPDTLDVDGDTYPSVERLDQIRTGNSIPGGGRWLVETFPLLCEELSPYAFCEVSDGLDIIGSPEKRIAFSTGGWSGCEDFINAVIENLMLRMCYYHSWQRGGHYEFRVLLSQLN